MGQRIDFDKQFVILINFYKLAFTKLSTAFVPTTTLIKVLNCVNQNGH